MVPPSVAIPGYRVLSVLGKGAMATVYRAEHERLGKEVALKVLDPTVALDGEFRERFLREARSAARVNHQNVVRALDAGIHEGLHYFVMELVRGEDLKDRLAREHHLEEEEALLIARAVAGGLDAASRLGIVHRDVKPENILISSEGDVKLTDLGLAKSTTEDPTLTKQGYTLGTVAFFSPEQCKGDRDIDVRSDLYSLGATLYVCLTGELPFGRGANAPDTMRRILKEEPPALAELAPDVSQATVELVERLMSKRRDDRPATGTEVVQAIDHALEETRSGRAKPAAPRKRRGSSSRMGSLRLWLGGGRRAGLPAGAGASALAAAVAVVGLATGVLTGVALLRDARVRQAVGLPTGGPR